MGTSQIGYHNRNNKQIIVVHKEHDKAYIPYNGMTIDNSILSDMGF